MRLTLADMRDTLFAAVACVAAGQVALSAPFLGLPLCALALGWLVYKRGMSIAIGGVLATGAVVVWLGGPIVGALLVVVLLVTGPWAARSLTRRSPWWAFLGVTIVAVVGSIGTLALEGVSRHVSLLGEIGLLANEMASAMKAYAVAQNTSAADATALATAMRLAVQQTWLTTYLLAAGLGALLSIYALGWAAKRAEVEVDGLPPLKDLDLSFHLTWLVVLGLALMAASRFMGTGVDALGIIGINLMILARGALFIQGLAVFAGLYNKANIGWFGRTLGYVFLVITEVITPAPVPIGLVSITGLVDLWVNIRKVPRQGMEPPLDSLEEPVGRL
jgi:hypothetical protein